MATPPTDTGPFVKAPTRRDGILRGLLALDAAGRFGRDYHSLLTGFDAHADGPIHPLLAHLPPPPPPRRVESLQLPTFMGDRRKPTDAQLRSAEWLTREQTSVCERVSELFRAQYAQVLPELVRRLQLEPGTQDFFPAAELPDATDRLIRLSEVHLAPSTGVIGIVVPCLLFQGSPYGVSITNYTEYELADDGTAHVSDED